MIDRLQAFLFNKSITKIIYTSFKIKLLAMLSLFLLFSFIFYGIFVKSVLANDGSVDNHIITMKNKLVKLIKKQKDLERLKQQVKILEQFNKQIQFSVPNRHSVPIFLSVLNEAISSSGVTIIDLSPAGVQKNKYLNLYALNFDAKLISTFSQLIKLFTVLVDMKSIVVITNIAIKREADEKLIVELSLQTYSHQGEGA